jgi:hypothetical protein
MARTGRRAGVLQAQLVRAGLTPVVTQPARPTGHTQHDELLSIYRQLGGLLALPAWRPGTWDLVFDGGLVVELDEELHFNRYRAMTLDASWGSDLPWTDEYRAYCAEFEGRCLAAGCWGKRWTNDSSARMFTGGPAGDLAAGGAPRWKQRALYDALKDTTAVAGVGLSLARLSIFDKVDGVALDDVLQERGSIDPEAVLGLVTARTAR